MKYIFCYLTIIFLVSACKKSTTYVAKDSSGGKEISFSGTAEIGKDKYLVNYDNTGWKDLVETNNLPKVDTLIVRRYSHTTGKPVATIEIKKFRVISKK